MVARPFLAKIPRKFLEEPELRGFFEYLVDYLQSTERSTSLIVSGDPNDPFGDLAPALTSEEGFGDNQVLLESVDQFRTFELNGGTYTAVNNDYVIARNGAIVIDPVSPPGGARFRVRNADGSSIAVRFDNGTSENGPAVGLARQGTVLDFQYSEFSNTWSIV